MSFMSLSGVRSAHTVVCVVSRSIVTEKSNFAEFFFVFDVEEQVKTWAFSIFERGCFFFVLP